VATTFDDSWFVSIPEVQRRFANCGYGKVYGLFDTGWLVRLKFGGRTLTTRECLDITDAAIRAGIDVTKPKPADLVIERQPDGRYTFIKSRKHLKRESA
jgi:hypothetical protein